jgi:four helix bundle protein
VDKEELKRRTKQFAIDCILFCEGLPNTFVGNHIKGQLTRCSSSVAANYRAACLAQSRAAYRSKLSIVIEEADESEFWLELIDDLKLKVKDEDKLHYLKNEAHELASIFIVTRRSLGIKK